MLRFIYGSHAKLAIIPVADILGLDGSARLNTTGSVGSPNWERRLATYNRLKNGKAGVRELPEQSNRI